MNFKDRCTAFFNLLESAQIKRTLENDKCRIIADKYNLAHVFLLFTRAKFIKSEYTVRNFYLALYLVHDLEEDLDNFKESILRDCLGSKKQYSKTHFLKFLQDRFKLFQKLKFRGKVTQMLCNRIMKKAPHWAWKRTRDVEHSGVIYKHSTCESCRLFLDF